MCGRYNVTPDAAAFIDAFEVTSGLDLLDPEPRYNIAPTPDTRIPVIRSRGGKRELAMVRWPLIPAWARGRPVNYSTANAKAETLAQRPAYRRPWQRQQRCLIPAHGYYEWQARGAKTHKQPFHIRRRDRGLFAFGGLWEASRGDNDETIESCTIVTTTPGPEFARIHSRMPFIPPTEAYAEWLDGPCDSAARWIGPCREAQFEAYPVSTYINNPRNDDARCLERVNPPTQLDLIGSTR